MTKRFQVAQAMLAERRIRDAVLGGDLFSDPAWGILLDLYVTEHRGESVKMSSVGAAASVAQTTAIRWIRILHDRGIITRTADPADSRRVFVQLSPSGRRQLEKVLDFFSNVMRSGSPELSMLDE